MAKRGWSKNAWTSSTRALNSASSSEGDGGDNGKDVAEDPKARVAGRKSRERAFLSSAVDMVVGIVGRVQLDPAEMS